MKARPAVVSALSPVAAEAVAQIVIETGLTGKLDERQSLGDGRKRCPDAPEHAALIEHLLRSDEEREARQLFRRGEARLGVPERDRERALPSIIRAQDEEVGEVLRAALGPVARHSHVAGELVGELGRALGCPVVFEVEVTRARRMDVASEAVRPDPIEAACLSR